MFVLVKERTAWWPVMFSSVTELGDVVENRIELKFVILGEDDFPAFVARLTEPAVALVEGGEAITAPVAQSPKDEKALETLLEVVRDWRHVGAENGEPLPFNRANFAALLNVPNTAAAIGRAYVACRSATPEVREGN